MSNPQLNSTDSGSPLSIASTMPGPATSPGQNNESELIIANTYRLNRRIFAGSFGEIRVGVHIERGIKIAAKLEPIDCKLPQLKIERAIYRKLNSENGFPVIYYFGQCDNYNALVMQLLAQNLEQVFDLCKRQFSLKTILYVAIQLITRFEAIHRHGIVYRDVKPENFMLGFDKQENLLFVIDFGLSKLFLDDSNRHIPAKKSNHYTGSARYMSLNAHRCQELSRRDDLESIGYMLLYILRQGKLPWSGFQGLSLKDRYQKIYHYKNSIPIETLCHGFPVEFSNYLRYVRSLEFEEEPNYEYMQTLFVDLFKRENFLDDGLCDWSNKITGTGTGQS